MNQVSIEIDAPVMENLARITIQDREAEVAFHLDNDDVQAAIEEGHSSVLELIAENCGSLGIDILEAAVINGTTVTLEGEDVSLEHVKVAFGFGVAAAALN